MDILDIELVKFNNMNNRMLGLKYDIETFEVEYCNRGIRAIEERKEYFMGCLHGLAIANIISSSDVHILRKKIERIAVLLETKK